MDNMAELHSPSYPDLLAKLADAATAATDSDRAKAQRSLEEALALLEGGGSASTTPRAAWPPQGALASWQAKRVATPIRENIGKRLRVGALAALGGPSPE